MIPVRLNLLPSCHSGQATLSIWLPGALPFYDFSSWQESCQARLHCSHAWISKHLSSCLTSCDLAMLLLCRTSCLGKGGLHCNRTDPYHKDQALLHALVRCKSLCYSLNKKRFTCTPGQVGGGPMQKLRSIFDCCPALCGCCRLFASQHTVVHTHFRLT